MASERNTICIVHYNTPELTRAAVLSIRKYGGEDWQIVIFDNSDERPFVGCAEMGDYIKYDNTKGKLVDIDGEFKKWPERDKDIGNALGCNFGSVKHMLSVEWLLQHEDGPFILVDSDILLKRPIDDLWDESVTACGQINSAYDNIHGVPRLIPFLCFINAPECRRLGVHYFDPQRSWGLNQGTLRNRNWYDTGASFLEDVQNHPEATLKRTDIMSRIEHLGAGSWRQKEKADEWLQKYKHLWTLAPQQRGIKAVAVCAIVRQEERYIREFIDHHKALGVSKFFIYDNGHGDEPSPAEVMQDYIDSGLVEVISWRDDKKAQCPAYTDCYKKHGDEYAWIGFLDIDEQVEFKNSKETLPKYLACMAAENAEVVLLNWRTMTDSGLTHYDPRPMKERFTEVMPLDRHVKYNQPENDHMKAFVRGGLNGVVFNSPHTPTSPQLRCVNGNGEPCKQGALVPYVHDCVWINHYHTKTAEEFMQKLRRGFTIGEHYDENYRRHAVEYFFKINERTEEKEVILRDALLTNPQSTRIMEHVIKEQTGDRQFRLTAESGWLLKSVKTGKTYREIDTLDLKRWEVIEDKAAVAQQHTQQEAAAEAKADGKPQTKKRANRKGK